MARQEQNGARPIEVRVRPRSKTKSIEDVAALDVLQEYHTDSNDSASLYDEQETALADLQDEDEADLPSPDILPLSETPLLPAELLQPLPSPIYSPQQLANIPWSQMSRKDKRAERSRSRKVKKQEWDQTRTEAKRNGVLQAGRVAQLRRGVHMGEGERVKSGRVQKMTTPNQISGRQRLLGQRKRAIDEGEVARPVRKATTKTKPRR